MVGELAYFLGLQVQQCEDCIFIFQSKHAKNLFKKFGLDSSRLVKTPMGTNFKLTKMMIISIPNFYRTMIGSLLYLTTSKPNIYFGVNVFAGIKHI